MHTNSYCSFVLHYTRTLYTALSCLVVSLQVMQYTYIHEATRLNCVNSVYKRRIYIFVNVRHSLNNVDNSAEYISFDDRIRDMVW